jgi:hypothetical protein
LSPRPAHKVLIGIHPRHFELVPEINSSDRRENRRLGREHGFKISTR